MRSKSMLALCLLLLFLTACQKQTSDDPIVASYKDTQIHESLVAYEKQNQINVTGDKTVSDADALDLDILVQNFQLPPQGDKFVRRDAEAKDIGKIR